MEWVSSRRVATLPGLLAAWLNVVQYHLQCIEMELVPQNLVFVSCLSSRPARIRKRVEEFTNGRYFTLLTSIMYYMVA